MEDSGPAMVCSRSFKGNVAVRRGPDGNRQCRVPVWIQPFFINPWSEVETDNLQGRDEDDIDRARLDEMNIRYKVRQKRYPAPSRHAAGMSPRGSLSIDR